MFSRSNPLTWMLYWREQGGWGPRELHAWKEGKGPLTPNPQLTRPPPPPRPPQTSGLRPSRTRQAEAQTAQSGSWAKTPPRGIHTLDLKFTSSEMRKKCTEVAPSLLHQSWGTWSSCNWRIELFQKLYDMKYFQIYRPPRIATIS